MTNNFNKPFFRCMHALQTILLNSNDKSVATYPYARSIAETLFWRFILSNFLATNTSVSDSPIQATLGLQKETLLGNLLDSILPLPALKKATLSLMEPLLRETRAAFVWKISETQGSIHKKHVLTPRDLVSILESKRDTGLGVAITPDWLAGYIVARSIKALIEDQMEVKLILTCEGNDAVLKIPDDMASTDLNELAYRLKRLRILDISVGYGAFYLASLRCLARLLSETTRLLRNNVHEDFRMDSLLSAYEGVYGIDIDPFSVAICKVPLALMFAREISRVNGSLDLKILMHYIDKAHLYVGNSIIGDAKPKRGLDQFFQEQNDVEHYAGTHNMRKQHLNPSLAAELSPFNWSSVIPEVIKEGGFDIIVGNPPYIGYRYISREMKRELQRLYVDVFEGIADLQTYFIARAIELVRSGGQITLLISRYFLEARYAEKMRNKIDSQAYLWKVVDLREAKVFKGKSNNVAVIFIVKRKADSARINTRVSILKDSVNRRALSLHHLVMLDASVGRQQLFKSFDAIRRKGTWQFLTDQGRALIEKIYKMSVPLGDLCFVGTGYHTGNDRIFSANIIREDGKFFGLINANGSIRKLPLESELTRPIVKTTDILPFAVDWQRRFVLYVWNVTDISNYPYILHYLNYYRSELEKRYEVEVKGGKWYELARIRNPHIFAREKKIVCPYRTPSPRFALDDQQRLHSIDCTSIVPKSDESIDIFYLLGILNSQVLDFVFRATAKKLDAKKLELYPRPLSNIPIKIPQSEREKIISRQISQLSQELLNEIQSSPIAHKRKISLLDDARRYPRYNLARSINDSSLQNLWEKIGQIDSFVFEMYALKESEIEFVKSSARNGV